MDPAVNASGSPAPDCLCWKAPSSWETRSSPSSTVWRKSVSIDNTRIVIGPNSRLRIDTFIFNPDYTAKNVTITAVKGVFRFISGNSPDGAYQIRTPTMTIGVRG